MPGDSNLSRNARDKPTKIEARQKPIENALFQRPNGTRAETPHLNQPPVSRTRRKRQAHHGSSLYLPAEAVLQKGYLLVRRAASAARARRRMLPVEPLEVTVRVLRVRVCV